MTDIREIPDTIGITAVLQPYYTPITAHTSRIEGEAPEVLI